MFSEDNGIENKEEIILDNVCRGTTNETTNFSEIRAVDGNLVGFQSNYYNFNLSVEYKKNK